MHKIWNYKKAMISLILTAMLVFASSCGNKETENLLDDKTEARTEKVTASEKSEDGTISINDAEIPETASEVSTSQTVIRRGKEFLDCGLSAGGGMLYTYKYISEKKGFYIAEMPEEGQLLSWSYIELPDYMALRETTTDNHGKCHILLIKRGQDMIEGRLIDGWTHEVGYIWTINRERKVEKKLDVSEIIAKEQSLPTCFVTDLDGNYYFDNENEIIRLNPDGDVTMRWSFDGYEIEALACGKSGKVYCIYEDHQGADILELLEKDGIADICLPLPKYDCKYCCMAAGIDAELLILNRIGGVFAYTAGDNVVKQRIWEKDMPVSGEDIFVDVILEDGRLCLTTKDRETEEMLYYYMPTAIGGENE